MRSLIFCSFLFMVCQLYGVAYQQGPSAKSPVKILADAEKLRYEDPEKALLLLGRAHTTFMGKHDTIAAIQSLLLKADIYGHQADYGKSYDAFWKSLFLSDAMNDQGLHAEVYLRLGRYYSFYKRKKKAIEYLEASLKINKLLMEKGDLDSANLVHNYYAFCATYRELGEPKMASIYLDSCQKFYAETSSQIPQQTLQFEKAYVLAKNNESIAALEILERIEPWFEKNLPSYLVLIYAYWGDIYRDRSNFAQSEKFYSKALETSSAWKSHIDFTPLVYQKLSELYANEGDFGKAFENQKIARELDAQFFDSRSKSNRPLLEIKDEFRLEKERQQKLIQKQRLEQLEQEDEILLLQRVILLGSLFFLICIGLIYLKQLRSKHRAEKELIKRNRQIEIQESKDLLELKNKELATSALRLVEKDEFLREIKTKLKGEKGNIKTSEINRVLKSISSSNQNNWEEFKLRFTAVNEKFYTKVTTKYPNLSQADQKICALIKLNFSSKEMARLLGISVESVHTTRYRLRKKMGLERGVNLEEFIANI